VYPHDNISSLLFSGMSVAYFENYTKHVIIHTYIYLLLIFVYTDK
jgi:hypothetical protein